MAQIILPQTGNIQDDIVDKSNANFTELYEARQFITPEDFGAIGDGVTDDTVEIQAALDSGDTLTIPKGKTYIISSLIISSNTTIQGLGGILKADANLPNGAMLTTGTSSKNNITLNGLVIDGNRANQTNGVTAISFGDSSHYIRVTDCNIYECTGAGILLAGHDMRIGYNAITNTNANSINAPSTPGHPIYNIDVIRNTLTLDDDGGNAGCIEFDDGAHDIVIDGNICIGTSTSEHLIQVEQECYNAIVVNNKTYNGSYGIYVGDLANKFDCKSIVSDNYTASAQTCGLLVENARFVTVQGNISELSGSDGFRFSGMEFSTVTGNLSINSGQLTSGRYGILVSECINSNFTGNLSVDDQDVATVGYGIYGTSGDGNTYVGNNAQGSITNDFVVVDTNTVSTANRGSTKDYGAVNSYLQTPLLMTSKIVHKNLTLTNTAIPTIGDGNLFYTGGTTTITNFTGASFNQPFTVVANHAMTINNGSIKLTGSANQVMAIDDCITFIRVTSGYIEIGRSIK